MIFSLDVRRARKGDCLLVHFGTKSDPGLVVIDGGPSQVYKPQLRPRLAQIRKARGLGASDALDVDLLMVSHIDDDHIKGVVELTKELVEAEDSSQALPFNVLGVWHNSFDDLLKTTPKELLSAVTAAFGPAALSGEPDTEGLDPGAAMVLASVDQGIQLRNDIRKLHLELNPQFGGDLIMATGKGKGKNMAKGLTFTVVGPMKAELLALQKAHDKFLKAQKQKTKAAVASFTDTSVPNLSSVVVLAEAGKKRMLLTGDARGDKILEGLELAGALKKGGKMHVDVLKVPHHGSARNMEPIFFRRITADHYVFSGNGEHGNPERETLQMLLDERGNENYSIHLTYPIDDIDIEREKDWKKEQAKEKARKKKNKNTKVRENWSPKKHGLNAFFAAHKDFSKKVEIVEDKKPHVIDLLDGLGF
jgi:beta-lactamase superfamily II metal-dependent hydrolase